MRFEEILERMLLEIADESRKNITFKETGVNYHNNQLDLRMDMFDGDELVAYAEYAIFEKKLYIQYIESLKRGKNYGFELMKHLADIYGYGNLIRTSLTPDGAKMRQKLDKYFNYDLKSEIKKNSKQLSRTDLKKVKDDVVRQFLEYGYQFGYKKAFGKYIDELRSTGYIDKYDFNEIADILEWVEGSFDDNQNYEDDLPYYTKITFDSLI